MRVRRPRTRTRTRTRHRPSGVVASQWKSSLAARLLSRSGRRRFAAPKLQDLLCRVCLGERNAALGCTSGTAPCATHASVGRTEPHAHQRILFCPGVAHARLASFSLLWTAAVKSSLRPCRPLAPKMHALSLVAFLLRNRSDRQHWRHATTCCPRSQRPLQSSLRPRSLAALGRTANSRRMTSAKASVVLPVAGATPPSSFSRLRKAGSATIWATF